MMDSISEYFKDGREAQKNYIRKHKATTPPRKLKKIAWWNPLIAVRGAGIFYEMAYPYVEPAMEKLHATGKSIKYGHIIPTYDVMKDDIYVLKIRLHLAKPGAEFERFNQFLELAHGRR